LTAAPYSDSVKRGLAAPLLFLALAFASWGSVDASPAIWLSAVVLLLVVAWLLAPAAAGISFLAVAVYGFAAWLVLTNWWINLAYSAAAPYHAAFIVCGFVVGRRAGTANATLLFCSSLAVILCLASWALWQEVTTPAQRARALFETPATLAATINLLLLPGIVALAFGQPRLPLVAAVVVLSAAWIAAGSLGGWLALALGALLAAALAHRAGFRLQTRPLALAAIAMTLGWLIAWLLPIVWDAMPSFGGAPGEAGLPTPAAPEREAIQSSAARQDLYQLALRSLSASSWLTGYGYLGFHYLMDAARETIPTYGVGTTYFVHSDYLQMLLELGIPGLALFVGLVMLPLAVAWQSVSRLADPKARLIVVAAVGAAGTMALHALVDFPFYIPVCVVLYGVSIGIIDSAAPSGFVSAHPLMKVGIAALVTLGAVLLIKPVGAEAAAAYAQRQWRTAQGPSAAYWFEVARRIEPRDWRYHWYAGQFWYAQASRGGKPEAAALADAAYAAGYAANPREVRNLLGRILTQRDLRGLLASPADGATLRAWIDAAVRLAPHEPALHRLKGATR
jgi:O-antigen ligase